MMCSSVYLVSWLRKKKRRRRGRRRITTWPLPLRLSCLRKAASATNCGSAPGVQIFGFSWCHHQDAAPASAAWWGDVGPGFRRRSRRSGVLTCCRPQVGASVGPLQLAIYGTAVPLRHALALSTFQRSRTFARFSKTFAIACIPFEMLTCAV